MLTRTVLHNESVNYKPVRLKNDLDAINMNEKISARLKRGRLKTITLINNTRTKSSYANICKCKRRLSKSYYTILLCLPVYLVSKCTFFLFECHIKSRYGQTLSDYLGFCQDCKNVY